MVSEECLADLALETLPHFAGPNVLDIAQHIDVIWFNERKFLDSVFEIEHSTGFKNSLLKFVELQEFRMVAHGARKREFHKVIEATAFKVIRDKVKFIDYDFLSSFHARSCELHELGKGGML